MEPAWLYIFSLGLKLVHVSVPTFICNREVLNRDFCSDSGPGWGTAILGGRGGGGGGLVPKFASEILVGAPDFASKNIGDKYPKFYPVNLRFDPKVWTFCQHLCLVVTEFPRFFLLFGELGRTLPQILPPNLM